MNAEPRRRLPKAAFALGLLVVGLLMGLSAGVMGQLAAAGAVLLALAFLAAFALSAVWWRGMDEVAREAHKIGWYWGGPLGMAIGFLAMLAGPEPGDLLSRSADSQGEAFVLGFAFCCFAQLVGYAVVWGGWWLAKSTPFRRG